MIDSNLFLSTNDLKLKKKMEINRKILVKYIIDEGLSYREIGKKYNVSDSYIRKKAMKLGIILPKRRKIANTETFNKNLTILDKISDDEFCEIVKKSKSWNELVYNIGYKNIGSKLKKLIHNRCERLNLRLNINKQTLIDNMTKGELFNNRKNWQSARSAIQKMAKKVYFSNHNNPKCHICGYDKHVEVAHLKSVSSFTDDIKIKEINSIDNLIGLCPNHHWEYDNGILKL